MVKTIDFNTEILEIINDLKKVEGYLDCEKAIIHNLRKQLERGYDDKSILNYLGELRKQIESRIGVNQNAYDSAMTDTAAFINILLKMSYWRSWMKTINM